MNTEPNVRVHLECHDIVPTMLPLVLVQLGEEPCQWAVGLM